MSTLEKNIMAPSEASAVVQGAFDTLNGKLPMSAVFPMKSTGGETQVRWTPTLPGAAVDSMLYRAWDAEAGYGKTERTSAEKYAGLFPLSKKAHISERDIIGHIGDSTYLRTMITDALERLGREAAATVETIRIGALVDAKYTVNGNGIQNATWDFDRPASLNVALSGTKKWNGTAAKPMEDIADWIKLIVAAQGRTPGAAIMDSATMAVLTKDAAFIAAATGIYDGTNKPTFITPLQVKGVLAAQFGLTDVRVIDEMYTQVERDNGIVLPIPVSTLIPSGTFVMFSSFNDINLGFTASGPTAEAKSAEYAINKPDNSGMIGIVTSDNAPTRYDVYVNGTMMPILVQAVSTLKATVL